MATLWIGSSNSLSGFSEEDDIKWQADAVRRAIEDVKNDPDPLVVEVRLETLQSRFPKGWKRMKEEDDKKNAAITVHKPSNDLVVLGGDFVKDASDGEPTAKPSEAPAQAPDVAKSIWRRVYEFVRQNVIRLYDYFFT